MGRSYFTHHWKRFLQAKYFYNGHRGEPLGELAALDVPGEGGDLVVHVRPVRAIGLVEQHVDVATALVERGRAATPGCEMESIVRVPASPTITLGPMPEVIFE